MGQRRAVPTTHRANECRGHAKTTTSRDGTTGRNNPKPSSTHSRRIYQDLQGLQRCQQTCGNQWPCQDQCIQVSLRKVRDHTFVGCPYALAKRGATECRKCWNNCKWIEMLSELFSFLRSVIQPTSLPTAPVKTWDTAKRNNSSSSRVSPLPSHSTTLPAEQLALLKGYKHENITPRLK